MQQNNLFLAWIDRSCAFDFRMFKENMNYFQFSWKTYTKHCTNNYVLPYVKRLFLLALCGWSSAFNSRIWSGKSKNKNIKLKTMLSKFQFWFFLFLFNLLTFLSLLQPQVVLFIMALVYGCGHLDNFKSF